MDYISNLEVCTPALGKLLCNQGQILLSGLCRNEESLDIISVVCME